MKGNLSRLLVLVFFAAVFSAVALSGHTISSHGAAVGASGLAASATLAPPSAYRWHYGDLPMNAVALRGASEAWAAGIDGVILHSTDGGRMWFHQQSGVGNTLRAVFFVDPNNGWAVGEKGIILHTTNGGETWQAQASNTSADLQTLWFVDAQHGWVGLPDAVLKTTDGGLTWVQVGSLPSEVKSLQFFDDYNGILICNSGSPGGGRIMRTADGGATWSAATCHYAGPGPSSGPCQGDFSALHFPDDNFGAAVGAWVGPIAFTTEDGGANWTEHKTNIDFAEPYAVFFLDHTLGWATGYRGTLLTKDGGQTWTLVKNSPNGDGIAFLNADEGLVAEGLGMKRTTDGGITWAPAQPFVSGAAVRGVSFVTPSEGWAVSQTWSPSGGRIIHTMDAGQTWQTQLETERSLNAVYFANARQGWAVGAKGVIATTANGGSTWTYQAAGTDFDLHDVYFVDPHYGWITGSSGGDGCVWRTADGGKHWTQSGLFEGWPSNAKYAVHFLSRTRGYIAGVAATSNSDKHGSVWSTTDGGDTWAEKPFGGQYGDVWGLSFINANEGWAVGNGGLIAHTTNGGDSWELQAGGSGYDLRDVVFLDAQRGYAVGLTENVLKTTNGGQTWTKEQVTNMARTWSGVYYYGISVPDSFHAWLAGYYGVWSYTDPLAPPSTVTPTPTTPPALDKHVYLPLVLR